MIVVILDSDETILDIRGHTFKVLQIIGLQGFCDNHLPDQLIEFGSLTSRVKIKLSRGS
jgi:hypothetical protein